MAEYSPFDSSVLGTRICKLYLIRSTGSVGQLPGQPRDSVASVNLFTILDGWDSIVISKWSRSRCPSTRRNAQLLIDIMPNLVHMEAHRKLTTAKWAGSTSALWDFGVRSRCVSEILDSNSQCLIVARVLDFRTLKNLPIVDRSQSWILKKLFLWTRVCTS